MPADRHRGDDPEIRLRGAWRRCRGPPARPMTRRTSSKPPLPSRTIKKIDITASLRIAQTGGPQRWLSEMIQNVDAMLTPGGDEARWESTSKHAVEMVKPVIEAFRGKL